MIEPEPLERQRHEQRVTIAGAQVVEIHHRASTRSEQHAIAFALGRDAGKLHLWQERPQDGVESVLGVRLRRAQRDPAFLQRFDE
jgi:hypothetical protein